MSLRLGGPLWNEFHSPEEWVEVVSAEGYSAAYCPLDVDASDNEVEAYSNAAKEAGIVISEVLAFGAMMGGWVNPVSSDESVAKKSIEYCSQALRLADAIGARCCVAIPGTRGEFWGGPHPDNLNAETYERVVTSVQEIIDGAQPTRSYYSLETMPWIAPYDTESYASLIEAIDREHFAVHFDPVNIISDPHKYYSTGEVIQGFLDELGGQVRSCHAKDILIRETLPPVAFEERRPGEGNLDYGTFLSALDKLDEEMPVMLEHLHSAEEYRAAADYVRQVAKAEGVSILAPASS